MLFIQLIFCVLISIIITIHIKKTFINLEKQNKFIYNKYRLTTEIEYVLKKIPPNIQGQNKFEIIKQLLNKFLLTIYNENEFLIQQVVPELNKTSNNTEILIQITLCKENIILQATIPHSPINSKVEKINN